MLQEIIFLADELSLPPPSYSHIPFYTLLCFFLLISFNALSMFFRLLTNKLVSFSSKPFSSTNAGSRKILILGDSTAVGAGASRAEDTIAGRLGRDYPNSQIINLGKNGGLIRDLHEQVTRVEHDTFDLIIVSAGGNDVWHFTRLSKIEEHLKLLLPKLKQMSNSRVIFLIYNNIGSAPLFPAPIRFFLKGRNERVHAVIRSRAHAEQVPVIDLFSTDTDNPFLNDREKLFAPDGIHPNSRGYEIWYNRMWREMTQSGYHYE